MGPAFEQGDGDPQAIRETAFEQGLVPHLAALGRARRQIDVKRKLAGWPGVGCLDIEIAETEPSTWVELKWAKRADTLFNCLWDTGKLAQAVREDRARYGYLVAGAPAAEWKKDTPYRRLFDVSCHLNDTLVTEHLKAWRGWHDENQNTFPFQMPTPVVTVPVGRVRFKSTTGEPWIIRVARVETFGNQAYSPRDLVWPGPAR